MRRHDGRQRHKFGPDRGPQTQLTRHQGWSDPLPIANPDEFLRLEEGRKPKRKPISLAPVSILRDD